MSWNDGTDILVPLNENPIEGENTQIEFYYHQITKEEGFINPRLQLVGPKFDLPLENVSWNIYVPERWEIGEVAGTLMPLKEPFTISKHISLRSYLDSENKRQIIKSREAESLLAMGNQFLKDGEQKRARNAFKSAYELSQHDQAFNEDARVQLENARTQQALYGLNRRNWNLRQAEQGLLAGSGMPQSKEGYYNFTIQDTQRLLSENSAEDNAVLMQVAEELVEQHAAAMAPRKSIRATLPEIGRKIGFKRLVFVDAWAPIQVSIERSSISSGQSAVRWDMLMGIIIVVVLVTSGSRVIAGAGRQAA